MPAPEVIGRYRLGHRLGAGGFAVVWLAHDESLDTDVAIKVMADNWADDLDLRERFLSEARMLRRAASQRVVQVFDIGELPDGRPYFVMDLADRGTLADVAEHGPLPVPVALRITAEVARGVAELHRAGIVHRDIKPSNVLIRSTPDGGERLMIADLGVAKNLAHGSGLTMSVGSAGYMAPEQAAPNLGVDVRADVYSLGALAYRLLTGTVPGHPGQVTPVRRLRPDLPDDAARLLTRALEPDRERRWPDAASLATQLDAVADRLTDGGRPPRAGRGGSRRGRVGVVAGVLALVVLAGLGAGFLIVRARAADQPVRVKDASGRVSVQVPGEWDRVVQPGGWDPAVLKLSGGTQPGLLVTTDPVAWSDLTKATDGVFVGVTTDRGLSAAVAGIKHPGCTARPDRTYQGAAWTAQVRSWGACSGGSGTIDEVAATATGGSGGTAIRVYVQIRQDGGTDQVRQILDGLTVRS